MLKTALQIAQTLVRSSASVTPTQHLLVPALSPRVPVATVQLCLVMAATATSVETVAMLDSWVTAATADAARPE